MKTKEDIADATLAYFEARSDLFATKHKISTPEYLEVEQALHRAYDKLKFTVSEYQQWTT